MIKVILLVRALMGNLRLQRLKIIVCIVDILRNGRRRAALRLAMWMCFIGLLHLIRKVLDRISRRVRIISWQLLTRKCRFLQLGMGRLREMRNE